MGTSRNCEGRWEGVSMRAESLSEVTRDSEAVERGEREQDGRRRKRDKLGAPCRAAPSLLGLGRSAVAPWGC